MTGLHPDIQRRFTALVAGGELAIPLLPEVAAQVLVLVGRPDCDARKLADLLRRDPALTAHVLKMANSPIYAAATKVVSLQQIIGRLGFSAILQLALVVASRARIFQVTGFEAEVRAAFRHSLTTALFAQEIARLRRSTVDEAFIAGLLHDIGRPLVLQALVDLHRQVELAPEPMFLLAAAETLHATIGGTLIEKWSLPAKIATAVRVHHTPEGNELATLVALADALAHAALDGTPLACTALSAALDLYPEDVDQVAAKSETILETVEALA